MTRLMLAWSTRSVLAPLVRDPSPLVLRSLGPCSAVGKVNKSSMVRVSSWTRDV